jgi:hypothetical protein
MLIIVAGFIAASDTLHDKVDELIVWSEGIIALKPLLGMAVFVLLAMLSAMVAFFFERHSGSRRGFRVGYNGVFHTFVVGMAAWRNCLVLHRSFSRPKSRRDAYWRR